MRPPASAIYDSIDEEEEYSIWIKNHEIIDLVKNPDELNKLNFIQSKNKLISNVTAQEISGTDELKDLLIKQIENRVRWRESVINMINNDVNHFIEIGPGKVLSGLVKRINKEVKISTINNQGDIEGLEI